MSDDTQYWYNTETGEVETGRRSTWNHLMGPYATREEAEQALERARVRNDVWEDEEGTWRKD
ncbi:SPOR domain-containing protein [Antribacter gilvus]|uniref:SPOR domain-containing protein n=1 Tax=Antribacter gilvus TaxID=2304675 RepID=UPI000F794958|nr:SPOR domain-containing protein [Antribacter gilvus]